MAAGAQLCHVAACLSHAPWAALGLTRASKNLEANSFAACQQRPPSRRSGFWQPPRPIYYAVARHIADLQPYNFYSAAIPAVEPPCLPDPHTRTACPACCLRCSALPPARLPASGVRPYHAPPRQHALAPRHSVGPTRPACPTARQPTSRRPPTRSRRSLGSSPASSVRSTSSSRRSSGDCEPQAASRRPLSRVLRA